MELAQNISRWIPALLLDSGSYLFVAHRSSMQQPDSRSRSVGCSRLNHKLIYIGVRPFNLILANNELLHCLLQNLLCQSLAIQQNRENRVSVRSSGTNIVAL